MFSDELLIIHAVYLRMQAMGETRAQAFAGVKADIMLVSSKLAAMREAMRGEDKTSQDNATAAAMDRLKDFKL